MSQPKISVADALSASSGGEALFVSAPQGRKSKKLVMDHGGELTQEDIETRLTLGADAEPKTLLRLRDSHHKAAKLFADGMNIAYISLHTGYAPTTLYILRQDPSFKQLIHFYREQKQEVYIDTHARLSDLANDAIGELRDRLTEDPENLKTGELLSIAEMALDRSGHGPTSTQRNINATISPEDMQRMKEEADKNETGVKIVEVRKAKSSKGERLPGDREVGDGKSSGQLPLAGTQETQRGESQGPNLGAEKQSKAETHVAAE